MMITNCLTKIKQPTVFPIYIVCFIYCKKSRSKFISSLLLYSLYYAEACYELAGPISVSFYSLYYAEACYELAGPISVSLCLGNTACLEEMLLRWRAVGNTVSDLIGPRDLNLQPSAPQTNALPLYHLAARPKLRF